MGRRACDAARSPELPLSMATQYSSPAGLGGVGFPLFVAMGSRRFSPASRRGTFVSAEGWCGRGRHGFRKGGRAVLLIRILHGAMYERRPRINREPIRRGDRRVTRERG